MTGPQIPLKFRSHHFSVSMAGLLALWIVFLAQIEGARPENASHATIAIVAFVSAGLFVLGSIGLDFAIRHLSGPYEQVGASRVSVTGVTGHHRFASQASRTRQTRTALLVTGTAGAAALLLATQVERSGSVIAAAIFASLVYWGSICFVRLCPVRGLPGGQLANDYLGLIAEDEESAGVSAVGLSYVSAVVISASGLLILASPGAWTIWGLAGFTAGIDCLVLTQWHSRRTRWIERVEHRSLESIAHSRLPTISQSAPISELFRIFAVEGNRATVVVLDSAGQPTGVIHLRQLRVAAHSRQAAGPREVMLSLEQMPRLPSSSNVLDAAILLERLHAPALVAEATTGKLKVISLDELHRILD